MLTADTTVEDWLQLIRAEYLEISGLSLTQLEVQRLWGLDPVTCESLLGALVDARFLTRVLVMTGTSELAPAGHRR